MNIKKIIGFSLVGLAVSFAQESAPVVANDQNPAQETALTELQSASTAPAVAPSAPVQEAPAQVAPESLLPKFPQKLLLQKLQFRNLFPQWNRFLLQKLPRLKSLPLNRLL